jgi:RNA polymerase sigma-70 factor (ECF subfamily)
MSTTQQTEHSGDFVQRLTAAQFALCAYITFLVGNPEDAKDILQDVNLTLWKEAAGYDFGRPFLAWAKAVAFYQVKTFRARQARDRLVFDETLLEKMAAEAAEADEDEGGMRRMLEALEHCVESLSAGQKALLRQRYAQGQGVNVIAGTLRRSADAVSMLLYRIRDKLGQCVERALAEEGSHA